MSLYLYSYFECQKRNYQSSLHENKIKQLETDLLNIRHVLKNIKNPDSTAIIVSKNPQYADIFRNIKFLEKALKICPIVYSLHKRNPSTRRFLINKISYLGGQVDRIFEQEISIPLTFKFHRKKKYLVKADLYRIKSF